MVYSLRWIIKIADAVDAVVNNILGALILFMSLAVVVSVIGREAANISYDWLEELCRYIHILIVMLGVGVVTYRGDQIVMDLVFNAIKGKAHIILNLINHIFILVFLCMGSFWGIQRVISLFEYGGKTSSKAFYSWQPALTVPVGFLVGAFLTLAVIIKLVYELKNYTPDQQKALNQDGSAEKEGD